MNLRKKIKTNLCSQNALTEPYKGSGESDINLPDTEFVSEVLAERLKNYISVLLGTPDKLSEFTQIDTSITDINGGVWLKLAIDNFDQIKGLAGWHNSHFLSYAIAVLSWLENPCTKNEDTFSMISLRHILQMTDPNKDLNTIKSTSLTAILDSLFDN